jgi:hypothetical protein
MDQLGRGLTLESIACTGSYIVRIKLSAMNTGCHHLAILLLTFPARSTLSSATTCSALILCQVSLQLFWKKKLRYSGEVRRKTSITQYKLDMWDVGMVSLPLRAKSHLYMQNHTGRSKAAVQAFPI